ncbi:MAG TPA: thermonuclease family protein, partial [Nitrospiraceae bacterium]|nr:thermonuclease family protein [Nitrospiraceae bacterium]
MWLMLLFFAVLFTLWLVASAMAGEFTGPVVGILDGDTIEVLHKKRPERIRLSGIDCPEKDQPFGDKAKYAASALVFGKEVTVQTQGKDKHRDMLAEVLLSDGSSVNK